jgi:glycosyltransferase involved in cell wall biosynthesis
MAMKQRTKLLLLIPHLGGGGAERVVAQLAQHLDPQRFKIHLALITCDGPGAEPPPASVTVHRFGATRVRQAWLQLLHLIRAEQPDVLLSGMAHLNFLVLLLKPLLPRRTRILIRQNTTASAAGANGLSRLAYRYLYPRADRIICQSQSMVDDLSTNFGVPFEKLAILFNPIQYNPIDTVAIQSICVARVKDRLSAASGPHLLSVGRLSIEKGVDLLLRALPQIKTSHPEMHLTILGTGPEEASLRQLSIQLDLENQVTFAGYANPSNYYAAATLFVLPSRYEGMPNALLEAAAAGLPIVATPCCAGVTDLLGNAPGTWLAPAIMPEALTQTILSALVALRSESSIQNEPSTPVRYHHAFLAPFELQTAIAAYANLLASEADPKRLAILIPTIDQIGGAESQVLLLAKELASRGWQVTLIALSGSGIAQAQNLAAANVKYLSLQMRKAWIDPRGWLRYLRWYRRHRPTILHAHLPHATWFVRWSRLLAPVRVVVDTIHTSKTTGNSGGPGRRRGYKLSRWLTNHVTCVSESVARSVLYADMARKKHLTVVSNGIRVPQPRQNSSPNVNFKWLAVGRLSPVKDYPTLLRAFAALPGRPALQIAGAGSEEPHLRQFAAKLQIANRVHFAGFHADVQPLLAAADAFVLSSLWEGLPIGILEASAASLPVVATDGAGTHETILAGETGLLVPVANPAALAEAMTQIMNMSRDQRQQMGTNGRQFVEQTYSLSKVADQWEQLFFRLLQDHPNRSRRG